MEAFLGKLQIIEKQQGEKFDAIIVPGDLVAHGVPFDPNNASAGGDYELLKETQRQIAERFHKYFPDTLLIPTLGNNDGKYHYQGIDPELKEDYYGTFFQHWFSEHPHNNALPNIDDVKSTFKYAGYYRVDVDSKLSILALNTMYLNKKNNNAT